MKKLGIPVFSPILETRYSINIITKAKTSQTNMNLETRSVFRLGEKKPRNWKELHCPSCY